MHIATGDSPGEPLMDGARTTSSRLDILGSDYTVRTGRERLGGLVGAIGQRRRTGRRLLARAEPNAGLAGAIVA